MVQIDTNIPVDTTINQPMPSPQPNSNKILQYRFFIIFSVVIIILIGIVGYFLGNKILNRPIAGQDFPNKSISHVTPTISQQEIANWRSYISTQYLNLDPNDYISHGGKPHILTFQYPPLWKIEQSNFNNVKWIKSQLYTDLPFEVHNPEADLSHEAAPADNSAIVYFVYGIIPQGTKDFDTQFWGSNYFSDKFDLSKLVLQKMSINHIAVSRISPYPSDTYYLFHISSTEELLIWIDFWNFDKNSSNTDFICGGNEDCKTIQKQLDQIISTINITTMVNPTSLVPSPVINMQDGWKTYINTRYNYSIMYPGDWSMTENASKDAAFFPPGADILANTQQNTPGSGVEPQVYVTIIKKQFSKPTNVSEIEPISLSNGLVGYYYIIPGAPFSRILFDIPYNNNKSTLEFSLTTLGQENIDYFNQQHHTHVKDADIETFKGMIKTFKYL